VILLIDADSLAYRNYFAHSELLGSEGQYAGLVFGFVQSLKKVVEELVPGLITFCWGDVRSRLWRRDVLPNYKAHRNSTPTDFSFQCDVLMDLLSAAGLPQVKCPVFEADDIIAALTKQALELKKSVGILTSDHDMHQLVRDGEPFVKVFSPKSVGSGYQVLGETQIIEKWGVPPTALPQLFSIRGEKGDGIPGVPGVGKIRAKQYLLGEASPTVREKINSHLELIRTNLKLIDLSFISIEDIGDSELPVLSQPMNTVAVMTALKRVGLLKKQSTLQSLKETLGLYEAIRSQGAHSQLEIEEEFFGRRG